MSGIVYILTNPAMSDLVKIGKTSKEDGLEPRIRQLYSTGVPVPFECHFACEVGDVDKVEKSLHFMFGDHRINPKREFFRINPERVKAALDLVSLKAVTLTSDIAEDESEAKALERARTRAAIFHFSMVDIQPGAELTFTKNESCTCRVIDDRKVEFEGQTGYLSPVTRALHNRECGTNWTSARGSDHWLYEGEILTDRRLRMEEEGE